MQSSAKVSWCFLSNGLTSVFPPKGGNTREKNSIAFIGNVYLSSALFVHF